MLHCHSTQPSKATATAEHHACQIGMVARYIVLPEHIGVAVPFQQQIRSAFMHVGESTCTIDWHHQHIR